MKDEYEVVGAESGTLVGYKKSVAQAREEVIAAVSKTIAYDRHTFDGDLILFYKGEELVGKVEVREAPELPDERTASIN